jgi:hypothetical protein
MKAIRYHLDSGSAMSSFSILSFFIILFPPSFDIFLSAFFLRYSIAKFSGSSLYFLPVKKNLAYFIPKISWMDINSFNLLFQITAYRVALITRAVLMQLCHNLKPYSSITNGFKIKAAEQFAFKL